MAAKLLWSGVGLIVDPRRDLAGRPGRLGATAGDDAVDRRRAAARRSPARIAETPAGFRDRRGTTRHLSRRRGRHRHRARRDDRSAPRAGEVGRSEGDLIAELSCPTNCEAVACRGRGADRGGRGRDPLLRAGSPSARRDPVTRAPPAMSSSRPISGASTPRGPRRRAAIARSDRFDALIAKTRITSPIDGVVIARFAHPGRDRRRGRTAGHHRRPEARSGRGRGR